MLIVQIALVFFCRIVAGGPPHYCYFCSTSLSDVEPTVQRQIMTQRLFHYPREAIKSRCQEPWLSRAGGLQICSSDEPMCASVQARTENNVNFTVLGCVDSVLRPSMKLPSKGDDQCVTVELAGLDFVICYCSTSLCNGGHATSSTLTASRYTKKVLKYNSVNFTSSKEADLDFMFSTKPGDSKNSIAHDSKESHRLASTTSTFEFDNETEEASGEMIIEETSPLPTSTAIVQTRTTTVGVYSKRTTLPFSYPKVKPVATSFPSVATTKPAPTASVNRLDLNSNAVDDEHDIVEMNSEEMERHASSGRLHSGESPNYDELSSPEVDYIPVTTKIFTKPPPTPSSTSKTTTVTTRLTTKPTSTRKPPTTTRKRPAFRPTPATVTFVETSTYEPIEIVSATVHTSILLTILASSNFIKQSKFTTANVTKRPPFPDLQIFRNLLVSSSTSSTRQAPTTRSTTNLYRTTRSTPTVFKPSTTPSPSFYKTTPFTSASTSSKTIPATSSSTSTFSFPVSHSSTTTSPVSPRLRIFISARLPNEPPRISSTRASVTTTTAMIMDQGLTEDTFNDTENGSVFPISNIERRQTTKKGDIKYADDVMDNETLSVRHIADDSPRNHLSPVGLKSVENSAAFSDTAELAPVSGAHLSQRFPGLCLKMMMILIRIICRFCYS